MTNPPRPSRPISVHLNPPNTTIPLKDLKKLAMRLRAHPKPVVRTVDLRSNVIPEDVEVSDFPPNVGAVGVYRNLRREGTALPRVKNSRASKRNTLTLVTGPRSIVQAFNPIYYLEEPAEATALRRGHDADIRGAKSSGLLTGWNQKMRNIPHDDDEDDSVTSDSEDMPAILPDEYIASSSSSSMEDMQDPGDEGDNKMSKEKGMTPEERRSPTLKKSPERSAGGPDSEKDYKVLCKELCQLMSHPQEVHIPCKRERRVPAAADPPVEGPKEEPETIFMSEWIVRDVEARDICVEGKRLDSNHPYWHSNVIMHRIQSNKLKTITGRVYQLVGDVDRATMSNEGYPPWLIAKFMNGFPEDWKRYVRFFCEVAKRKRLQKMKPKPAGNSTKPQTTSRSRAAAISDSDNDLETLKRKVVSRKPEKAVAIEKASFCNQEAQTSTAETWGNPTDNTRLSETSCVSTTSRCGRHIKPVLKFWCGERLSVDCLMGTSIVRQGEDMLTHSLERVLNRGLDRRINAAAKKMPSQKTVLKKRTSEGGAQAQLDAMTPKVKAAHKTGVNIPGLNKAKQRKNKALFNSARVILTPMHTKQDIRSKCLTNKVHYDSPSETSGDNNSVFNSDLNVEKGRKRGPRREDPSIVRNLTFELDNGEGGGIVTENVDEKVSSLSVKRKQKTIPTRKAKKTRTPSSSESQKNTELHKPVMRRLTSTKAGKAAPEQRTLPFRRARPVGCFAEYEDIDKEDTPKRNMRKPDNSGKTHLEHGVVHSKQPPRLKPPQYFLESSSDSEDKRRKNSRNPKMRNIIESEDSEKEPITGKKSRTATNGEEKQKQIGFLESEDSEDELTLKASRQVANAQKKKKNVALFESQNLEKELKSGKESATTTIDLKKQQKKTEESQDLEGEPILKKAARHGASARKKKKQDGLLESQYSRKDQITEKESSTAPNCGKKQKQIGVVESEDSEEEQMLIKASRQVANAQKKKKKIGLLESEEEPVSRKESRTDINAQKEQKVPSRPGRKQKELVESEDSEVEQMLRKASRQEANAQKKKKKVGLLESEEQITRKMQTTAADTLKVQKNIKSLVSQDSEQERTSRNESRQTAKTQKIQKTAEEQIGLEEYKDSEDEKMSRKVSSQWTNAQKKQASTQPAPDRTQSARLSKIKTTPAELNSERDVSPGRDSRQSGNRKRQPPSDIASSGSPGPSPSYQEQQRKANEEDSQPVSASPQKKSPESRLPFLVEAFLVEPLSNSSSEDEENNSWQELTLPRYTKRAIVSTPAPTRSQHHPGTSQEPECEFEKLQGKPIIPQKNSKKLKPNLHGVSSTEFSSSEEENEDQKAAAGKKKPKATKNMSRNVNSQDGQPQRNVLAVKSSAKWVPLNPYADIIREMEWKEEEIKRLNKAVSSLPKHKTEFWQDVAAAVGVRSAEECYDKFQEILETSPSNAPAKKKVNSRKKKQEVNEEKKEAVKISAKVGTLKRKRQMREFLNQMPKDNYDDMFTDDLYRDMKVKLPALPAKSDDDLCVLENMKPVSPSSPEFPFVATPQCEHITPGMLSPYNSSENDRLVYRLQKDIKGDMLRLRRPLQKKSGPFFNATPTSRRTTFVNPVPKDIIGKLFAAKDAVTSDEEEEKDYYFSDSDEQ